MPDKATECYYPSDYNIKKNKIFSESLRVVLNSPPQDRGLLRRSTHWKRLNRCQINP